MGSEMCIRDRTRSSHFSNRTENLTKKAHPGNVLDYIVVVVVVVLCTISGQPLPRKALIASRNPIRAFIGNRNIFPDKIGNIVRRYASELVINSKLSVIGALEPFPQVPRLRMRDQR